MLIAAIAGITAITLFTQRSPFVQGLVIGVTATVLVGFFLLIFLISTGSMYALAGAWGESFTNDEIKTATKRGQIWGAVANIEIGGFDIDHLVIAPGGVFAIETKHHTAKINSSRKSADLDQARDAARKASLVLKSKPIDMQHEVTPVLVIWGKASADLKGGSRVVAGVRLLAGSDLPEWLSRQSTGRLAQDTAEEMLARVAAFRDSQVLRAPVLT